MCVTVFASFTYFTYLLLHDMYGPADSSHGESHVGSVSPAATRTRTLALTRTRTRTLALALTLTAHPHSLLHLCTASSASLRAASASTCTTSSSEGRQVTDTSGESRSRDAVVRAPFWRGWLLHREVALLRDHGIGDVREFAAWCNRQTFLSTWAA